MTEREDNSLTNRKAILLTDDLSPKGAFKARGGYYTGLVTTLRETGFTDIGIFSTDFKDAPFFDSKRHRLLPGCFETSSYQEAFEQLSSEYEICGIIDLTQTFSGSRPLARLIAPFAERRDFPVNSPSAVLLANNKYLTRRALERAGERSVGYRLITGMKDLPSLEGLTWPVILKPVVGAGSSFVYKCRSESEL